MVYKKKGVFDFYFGPMSEKRIAAFYVSKKRRNLFLTATDLTGAVLGSISAKSFVSDRKKRFADHIIALLIKKIVFIFKAYRVESVRLFLRISKSRFIRAVMNALRSSGIKLVLAQDLIPTPHNGCRRKKVRRL
jgi:ribosomal protein S11